MRPATRSQARLEESLTNLEPKDGRLPPGGWTPLVLDAGMLGLGLTGVFAAIWWPDRLPGFALAGLIASWWPVAGAWRATRGMALRPAVAWSAVAILTAAVSQIVAIGEPIASGRPGAGHWAYLASLATLAAGVSVFGARRPGGGAWAILTGLLVLVFLIPWLEGSGLKAGGGPDRLRLEAPWSIFYAAIAAAVVTNYLPTRFGPAAVLLGASLLAEFVGLALPIPTAEAKSLFWSLGPFALGLAALRAGFIGAFPPARRANRPTPPGLPSLWSWFRDAWGVVWALRVRERFNRAAEASRWPIRLSWHGVEPVGGEDKAEVPPAAEATFAGLIRRFASPERVAEVARGSGADPCPRVPGPGQ